ncbi:DUF805 domain-containing protein [Mannheimia varigena]|uniref:DUF805 domain-containing protein n=1 Tax=Mannheimia varigena TaxID=85404 RepID=UPI0015B62C0F|nr:DUF805 domain-containing protein [Mannheimia varigena]QLD33561.1 DUF805 domain-containing protein [Mannheimia varigena]
MNSIKSIFGFFFGFKGRIVRLHYGLFLPIFAVIYLFIVGFLALIVPKINYHIMQGTFGLAEDFLFLAVIFAVVALILVFKYSHIVRRIHDLNKKATDTNLFNTVLWIDILSPFTLLITSDIKLLVNLVMTVLSISCLITLAFKKGNEGENDFGKPQVPFWKKTNS